MDLDDQQGKCFTIEKAFPSFVLEFDHRYLTFVCAGVALDWIATAMGVE